MLKIGVKNVYKPSHDCVWNVRLTKLGCIELWFPIYPKKKNIGINEWKISPFLKKVSLNAFWSSQCESRSETAKIFFEFHLIDPIMKKIFLRKSNKSPYWKFFPVLHVR